MPRYIDADSTIRAICGTKCGCERDECGYEIPCQQVQMIEATPTTDVRKNVHGEWISTDLTGFERCSVCGALWGVDITGNLFCCYCPRCGAKMDLKGEKEGK